MGKKSNAIHANNFAPAAFSTKLCRTAGTPMLEFLGNRELQVLHIEQRASKPTNILLKMFLLSYKDMNHLENTLLRDSKSSHSGLIKFHISCILHVFPNPLFHTELECCCSPGVPGFGNGFTSLPQPSVTSMPSLGTTELSELQVSVFRDGKRHLQQ